MEMRWQTIRNGLTLIGLTLGISWGIASFTYGSAPSTNIELASQEPELRDASPISSPTSSIDITPDTDEGEDTLEEGGLITDDITAQVLNGSGIEGAGDEMARRLRRLGFDVIITDSASEAPETTVFWSSGASRTAAQALAREFDWKARVKPPTIFAPADIHVLVGQDV